MKKFLYVLPLAMIFSASCGNHEEEKKEETSSVDTSYMYFGDTINMDGAVPAEMIGPKMAEIDSFKVKVTGPVNEVCQKKGCWMTMKIGKDEVMQIRFKDYGFFVPKNVSGKTAWIEGMAFRDTTTVEMLKHYAEDAGKSKEEIEKISAPEVSISFEATGVIIRK